MSRHASSFSLSADRRRQFVSRRIHFCRRPTAHAAPHTVQSGYHAASRLLSGHSAKKRKRRLRSYAFASVSSHLSHPDIHLFFAFALALLLLGFSFCSSVFLLIRIRNGRGSRPPAGPTRFIVASPSPGEVFQIRENRKRGSESRRANME